jgi:hypothetical protein
MTLRQKQSEFARHLSRLVFMIYSAGYEVTFGDVYRSPEEQARLHKLNPKGAAPPGRSCHELKLAADLNLFKNGVYLSSTESHRAFGEWWESQSTSEYTCVWGGRFGDGNHYSIAHGGRK